MDMTKEELSILFEIMDSDESGTVDYREFVESLYNIKSEDSHKILVLLKHWVMELRCRIMPLNNKSMPSVLSNIQHEIHELQVSMENQLHEMQACVRQLQEVDLLAYKTQDAQSGSTQTTCIDSAQTALKCQDSSSTSNSLGSRSLGTLSRNDWEAQAPPLLGSRFALPSVSGLGVGVRHARISAPNVKTSLTETGGVQQNNSHALDP